MPKVTPSPKYFCYFPIFSAMFMSLLWFYRRLTNS
jgi:hypothetical protein